MANYTEFSQLREAMESGHPTWRVDGSFGKESLCLRGAEGRRALLLAVADWSTPPTERKGATAIFVGTAANFAEHRSAVEQNGFAHAQFLILPAAEAVFGLMLDTVPSPASADATELDRVRYENNLLVDIGRSLGQERDIVALLDLLITRAREVTRADAGSVYVVKETEGEDDRVLKFVEAQNASRTIELETKGVEMPLSSSSIVGACVLSGEVINIPDLYKLAAPGSEENPWGFVHDRTFDRQYEYQTRSMVTIPIISAREQVIGVVQLINRKRPEVATLNAPEDFDNNVEPFDSISIQLAKAVASQAGLALENALLYQEVQTMFDGFVRASVTAIESRDPTTSGHSMRVADLTVGIAKIAGKEASGPYADFSMTREQIKQAEYAALLHDFGKVGVREHVLVKAQKLYHHERQIIESRFEFIRRSLQTEQLESKVRFLLDKTREDALTELTRIDGEAEERLRELDEFVEFIMKANRPTIMEKTGSERLEQIAARTYKDLAGQERPYLTGDEMTSLQIARGSLTEDERREIESHVVHTYEFLRRIPWGKTYQDVPKIAGSHHEKLDGTGYPNKIASEVIPVPTKMMTIADIFDALTAHDRPYKKSVPLDKALDILNEEAGRGKIDSELLRMFLESKIYESVLPKG